MKGNQVPFHTMYDIFFLSYDEPHADLAWRYLSGKWPWARRVSGVSGIAEAHIECAKRSLTSNFFVVDADNFPDADFPFDLKLPEYDKEFTHVWFARNKACDMAYGWGGVKLFNKKNVLAFTGNYTDFTMSFGLKVIEEAKSTTFFNSTPFDSWRSAFRECAKLSLVADRDAISATRLSKWKNPLPDAKHREYIVSGAHMGSEHSIGGDMLKINDWQWLNSLFEEKHAQQSI